MGVRNSMRRTIAVLVTFGLFLASGLGQQDIQIINQGTVVPKVELFVMGSVGDMNINNHYRPAVIYFRNGIFSNAKGDLDYFIARADFLKGRADQADYMSNAHYLRALIYLYHAKGIGRNVLAKRDLESSIRWNAKNYPPYFELSHLWTKMGMEKQAAAVLQRLLQTFPEEKIVAQAQRELSTLMSGRGK